MVIALLNWNGVKRWQLLLLILIFILFEYIIHKKYNFENDCFLTQLIIGCPLNDFTFYIKKNTSSEIRKYCSYNNDYERYIIVIYKDLLHLILFLLIGIFYNFYIYLFCSIGSVIYDYYSYNCKDLLELVFDFIGYFISFIIIYLIKKYKL